MRISVIPRSSLDLILTCFSLIGLFFDPSVCVHPSPSDSLTGERNQIPKLIIPLRFSSYNSSLHPRAEYRHRLEQSQLLPNAQMRLYDDLLTNGYYTTRLWIGTPPQEFALIVDTGSTVTYVPCSFCERCGNHQDPRFQPDLSSTYQPLKCSADCNCDDKENQCVYERSYAEKSSSSGVLSEDMINFGNESKLVMQRAVFGCETSETGDIYSQRADGIMGLGRGRLSIVDQLVDKGVIEDSFSLCYGGMEVGGGAMVLGKISPPADMVFSHSDPFRSPHYNIELKQIHVAGKPLKINPKVFDEKQGTILDSGTTYAYFPIEAFEAFKEAVIKEVPSLKRIHGPDPNYDDICFSGAGRDVSQLSKVFPEVAMQFADGQKLSLSPENYLFRHIKVRGAYCLGVFPNGDATTLLGGILVRNTLVTYDRENDMIGFWKTNCSDLWNTLESQNASAPAPLVSQTNNISARTSSNPAPAVSTSNDLPVVFRIGVITFDVSISMNDSSIKPNVTELAELIARELDLDSSQVRLLNFSSKGNDCLVKWGIFPPQSSEYISNNAALNIISLLKEHRLHLPERFGSYQLVEWKAEPKDKQSWWDEHFLSVIIGAIVSVLVIISSTIGIWLVRRRSREERTTYSPVDAVVSEQELQPLSSQTSDV